MIFRAMLLDAYRELNSRALFWVVLGLSGLIVVVFGAIGFNDEGMSFLGFTIAREELLARDTPMASLLYRSIFSTIIVNVWLGWIATILALISTATIFPDFVASGAIDIVLAKPIGRLRLFIYKYVVSLLFVLLQVGMFCTGIFLCMGLRLGEWEWRIFAAIPVVVIFFSYLFAISVLIGVRTRSAITAILMTMLFWLGLWLLNTSESATNQFRHQFHAQADRRQVQIENGQAQLERWAVTESATPDEVALIEQRRASQMGRIERWEEERAKLVETADKLDAWHQRVRIIQAPLPKTAETIGLVDRWLRRSTDINLLDIMQMNVQVGPDGTMQSTDDTVDREVLARVESDLFGRSWAYVLGTSLGFELFVLGIAAWMFVRRDF